MKTVDLYTDGACSGNPGPGGCAAILIHGPHRKELTRGFRRTTNNRMELLAVLLGLRALKDPCIVDIHTDSRYVMDAIEEGWLQRWKTNGWRTTARKPVKNDDLWKDLDAALAPHQTRFHWIKGHRGHPENTRCDTLAVAASKAPTLEIDSAFESEPPSPQLNIEF